jgi:hypothetical protein
VISFDLKKFRSLLPAYCEVYGTSQIYPSGEFRTYTNFGSVDIQLEEGDTEEDVAQLVQKNIENLQDATQIEQNLNPLLKRKLDAIKRDITQLHINVVDDSANAIAKLQADNLRLLDELTRALTQLSQANHRLYDLMDAAKPPKKEDP